MSKPELFHVNMSRQYWGDSKLQTLTPEKGRPPQIHIHKDEYFTIYKLTLRLIGNPPNITFWWSGRDKTLLIGGSDASSRQSFRVNSCYYEHRCTLKIRARNLVKAIAKLAGLSKNAVYIVNGEYIGELNMVGFKMTEANMEVVESDEQKRE